MKTNRVCVCVCVCVYVYVYVFCKKKTVWGKHIQAMLFFMECS
jgi:Na+/proline symporter